MKCILHDTKSHENFYPFSLNHAMFEVRSGAFTCIERIILENNLLASDMILMVREDIQSVVAERFPEATVNPIEIPETNLEIFFDELNESSYIWDLLNMQSSFLINDFKHFQESVDGNSHESSILVNSRHIHISKSAIIAAGTVLDASNGPIIIDSNAFIDIGALVKGPVYIGKNSIINPGAKICGNVTVGPFCKIGGEIEDSIFHGFSNKQHDGYLGHSYIGEWVNLGANTNNSDLKNNYSNVRIKIGEKSIDTKQMFVGCMVGDYSKTGISTMINTGTYIGMGANVFGGGFQNKYIPSFSWGATDKTDINKFIDTLKIVKNRRKKSVSNNELELIQRLYSSEKFEGL